MLSSVNFKETAIFPLARNASDFHHIQKNYLWSCNFRLIILDTVSSIWDDYRILSIIHQHYSDTDYQG